MKFLTIVSLMSILVSEINAGILRCPSLLDVERGNSGGLTNQEMLVCVTMHHRVCILGRNSGGQTCRRWNTQGIEILTQN